MMWPNILFWNHILQCVLAVRLNTHFTGYKYQFVFVQCFTISIYAGLLGPLVMDAYKRQTKKIVSVWYMCVCVCKREGLKHSRSILHEENYPNACSSLLLITLKPSVFFFFMFLLSSSPFQPLLFSPFRCIPAQRYLYVTITFSCTESVPFLINFSGWTFIFLPPSSFHCSHNVAWN